MKINNDLSSFVYVMIIGYISSFLFMKLGIIGVDKPIETIDGLLIACSKFSLTAVCSFYAMHFAFTRMHCISRGLYSLAGSISFASAAWMLTSPERFDAFLASGVFALGVAPVMAAGAISGFIYHNTAGVDSSIEELEGLQTRSNNRSHGSSENSNVAFDTVEYFDGPIQVKTSIGALFIAALFGLVAFDFIGYVRILLPDFLSMVTNTSKTPLIAGNGESLSAQLNFELLMVITNKMIFLVPYAVFILICHFVARAFSITSYAGYLGISVAVPIGLIVLVYQVPGFGSFLGYYLAVPISIGSLFYRRFAGVEPKSLPEDLVVSDQRTLVGAHHARRQYRRVVANSKF